MAELPKHLQTFLARDLVYVLGGSSTIAAFLYSFDHLPGNTVPLAYYLLAAGIGYGVGCVLQEAFGVTGLVTTAGVPEAGRLLKWMFKRFSGENWANVGPLDLTKVWRGLRLQHQQDEHRRAVYERMITHMLLGATGAPCALVSGGLLVWRAARTRSMFDIALASASLILALAFWMMNWLKAMQITQRDAEALAEAEKAKETR